MSNDNAIVSKIMQAIVMICKRNNLHYRRILNSCMDTSQLIIAAHKSTINDHSLYIELETDKYTGAQTISVFDSDDVWRFCTKQPGFEKMNDIVDLDDNLLTNIIANIEHRKTLYRKPSGRIDQPRKYTERICTDYHPHKIQGVEKSLRRWCESYLNMLEKTIIAKDRLDALRHVIQHYTNPENETIIYICAIYAASGHALCENVHPTVWYGDKDAPLPLEDERIASLTHIFRNAHHGEHMISNGFECLLKYYKITPAEFVKSALLYNNDY